MHQITSEQFQQAVELDPAWASKLTEPVEITEFCELIDSDITHLSPLLHFTGRNDSGDAAAFYDCKSLKVAQGTFHGCAIFSESGIEKIGNLTITKPDDHGDAASFSWCQSLKVAEATFPGSVDFAESGIEKIGDLTITSPNNAGEYLFVDGSPVAKKPHELRKFFQGKPLAELQTALQATRDDPVKRALESVIGRRVLKNNNPEIEL